MTEWRSGGGVSHALLWLLCPLSATRPYPLRLLACGAPAAVLHDQQKWKVGSVLSALDESRATCSECGAPRPRADRGTCGESLCVESARLQVAARRAREAARAAVGAPRCHRCDEPHGRASWALYCVRCAEEVDESRRVERRKQSERDRQDAARKICQGPKCSEPVGLSGGRDRLYCSDPCRRAAEHVRKRARTKPEPVPCRRCGQPVVLKFRDGVCSSCQKKQRTAARRVTVQREVRKAHGDAGCFHCSAPLPEGGVIDHLRPISRGGLSTVANLRVVCVLCNASKKDQLMDEWSPLLPTAR
ncbi:HNH endonuclease [Streptomyces kasugaensis]|uniref:HNH endonuclease n=1 Tax=Streptomyces kasugaensis TaxID=1946 RepID=A0A4Q9HWI7_STRKA|nr:HNH endonuclease [Streptomyces kasugaensis]